jgi:hypothetical protein
MKEILEPLAIANNVTQAHYTRLDHIGLMLANLYRIYSTEAIEAPIHDQVLGSLEKRWCAADQDIFILAIYLHPWIRGHCFAKILSRSTLCHMAETVFERVFEEKPGFELMDYGEATGLYSDESMRLEFWKTKYEESVRCSPILKM